MKLRVKWCGYEEQTYDPLTNLYDDVPYIVRKYVGGENAARLTRAYNECKAAELAAKKANE